MNSPRTGLDVLGKPQMSFKFPFPSPRGVKHKACCHVKAVVFPAKAKVARETFKFSLFSFVFGRRVSGSLATFTGKA